MPGSLKNPITRWAFKLRFVVVVLVYFGLATSLATFSKNWVNLFSPSHGHPGFGLSFQLFNSNLGCIAHPSKTFLLFETACSHKILL